MRKRSNKINFKLIFDIFAVVSLTVFFILEICKVIDIHFDNKLVFELIIVLLPAIITIVSISLSLAKEKVYGVSLDDFVKLRKKSIYSFTHMVVIMSISVGLYTIFHTFSTDVTIFVLDGFAFGYSMIFSIQEIPVLVRDKERLNKIIRYRYENEDKNELFLSQSSNKTLYDVIQYMVLNDGIIATYNSLKKNKDKDTKNYNSHLFDYLLTVQNKYFWDASEDIEVLSSNLSGEYKNIEIIKAIETAYSNVEVLLSRDESINYEKDFPDDKTYHLTRSIFALHRLCVNLKLEEKEKEKLKDIISDVLLSNYANKGSNRMLSFTVLMSVVSLNDGDVWFIKNLRDNNLYSSALFSFENCLLGLFISIYLAHILNQNFVSNDKRNNILTFLSEPAAGLNSDGSSWNQLVARMLEFSNSKLITSSLKELIHIYESIPESQYYFMKNMVITDDSRNFDKTDILDAWLEIMLFGECFGIDKTDVEKVIKELDDDTKMFLINSLSKKWIVDYQLNKNYQIKFLKHFNIHVDAVDENFYNKEIIEFLAKYKNDYYKNNLINKINNDSEDVKEMKEDIKTAFDKCIQDNDFIDETVDLSSEKPVFLGWRLEKGDLKMLLDAYLKQLPESLMYSFRKKIESALEPEIIDGYKLTEQQIRLIEKFKPNKHSSLNVLIYNSADEMKIIRDDIPLIKSEWLPFNLYFKDSAIKINAKYDDEHSDIRFLKDEEIDNIIDNEYQLINGLYRFSEFSNDTTRSFLVTRDELKQLLKSRIMYAFVVFKAKVVVDKEKCLWFKLNKSNH